MRREEERGGEVPAAKVAEEVVSRIQQDAVEEGDGDPGEHGGGCGGPGPRLQQSPELAVVELLEDSTFAPAHVQPPGS